MADNYLDSFSQEGVYFISGAEKVLVTRTDSISVGPRPPEVLPNCQALSWWRRE